jgi:elongator complex protein 6
MKKHGKFAYIDDSSSLLDEYTPERFEQLLSKSLDTAQSTETVLILEHPGVLLGTTSLTADDLVSALYAVRSKVYSTVVMLQSDIFVPTQRESEGSPLQLEQQQLLISCAHQADYVVSVRKLDTGLAKDISGVVRITSNGLKRSGKEYLYRVDTNLSAKAWDRGDF